MMGDPLLPLLRLRRLARDAALQDLAAALRAEADAAQGVAELEAAIARETEAAGALSGDDSVVEAFGRWLREARRARGAAEARRDGASAEVGLARAVLAAARAAVEAAEALAERRREEARAAALRGEQHALDESAARGRTDGLSD
jgi:flagellar export protein FliJ